MGKQSAPSQQTVTQRTELPAWVTQAGQENYDLAKTTAANLNPPVAQNVAGYTPEQTGAWAQAMTGLTAGSGAVATAANMLTGGGLSVTPHDVTGTSVAVDPITGQQQSVTADQVAGKQQTVGARTFSADALAPYLNPYTDQVVNAGLSDLERQRLTTQVSNGDAAAKAGAFGGSRQAVQAGVTDAETARSAGQLSAQLRDQAFNTAAGLLSSDNDRVLTADRANQATNLDATKADQAARLAADQGNQSTILASTRADQTSKLQADLANQATALDVSKTNAANWLSADTGNANRALATSAQLAALGQQQSNNVWKQAAITEGIGDKEQANTQANLDAQTANGRAVRSFPVEQLNLRLAALGQTPYGQTTSTTGPATQQGGNPLLGLLGGAAQGASIASTLGLASGAGGGVGAGLGGLVGLLAMSDENEKTDIKRVGKDPKTGLPLYSYRYKGDPKTYPKVVGPMAQDIEKRFPGAVTKVPGTGRRAVDAGFLGGVMAAPIGRGAAETGGGRGRPALEPDAVPPVHMLPPGGFLSGGMAPPPRPHAAERRRAASRTPRPAAFLGGRA